MMTIDGFGQRHDNRGSAQGNSRGSVIAARWLRTVLASTVLCAGAWLGSARAETATMVLATEPPTLVSLTNVATTALAVSGKVTEGLLEYDENLSPKPLLATSWNISSDGKEYSFKLREGVRWHDGKPFTAEDAAFSINLLRKVHPRGRTTFANVTSAEAPDPQTLVIRLSQPAPYLIKAFASSETPIVPKHLYEGTDAASNPNGNAPIGTGPFKFKEWQRGNYIVYERNPDYWGKPDPRIDQLVVKFIPDAAARSIAFESGSVDFGYRTPVALSDLDRLKSLPNLKFETKGASYSYNVTRLEFNLDNQYFRDKRVREAVARAIDRKVIVNTIHYGYATVTYSPIAPGLKEFHDPTPSPYAYDLKAAAKLLDEAGLKPTDGKTRFRLTLDFNPITTEGRRLAEYIRASLSRIGIAVDLRAQDISAFVKRIYTDRDFDFAVNGASDLFDPSVGVQRLYWSKSFVKGVPFSNATHYSNPEVDRLLEQAAVENDPGTRVDLFKKFQDIVAQDIPDLNLVSPTFLTLHNVKIHDLVTTADGAEANLAHVYVK
jgi:peptide/nickel transport system substrate-binding protein